MRRIAATDLILIFTLASMLISSCKKEMDVPDETDSPTLLYPETDEQYSGGLLGTTFDFSENAFGKEIPNLTGQQLNDFVVGNSFFRSNWVIAPSSTTARDGLGALFNSRSCGGCHPKDGRAAPPAFPTSPLGGLLFRLSISGNDPHGGPNPEPNYGTQLGNFAILGVTPEGNVQVTYTEIAGSYPDGTPYSLRKPNYLFTDLGYGELSAGFMFSPRIANQVMGLGLLETVPDADILALEDIGDANADGISGKANLVWDVASQSFKLGKFGWKANQPNIRQQTAAAFHGDIGITSSLFPDEDLTPIQMGLYGDLPSGGEPEIEDANLARTVSYMRTLAVPARRNVSNQTVLKGKQIFNQINCSGCHIPSLKTAASDIPQLSNQTIRPYTDLLLHDMGEDLADNRPDFLANGNEWRTAPLWGTGLLQTVNNHTFLLHDGRARNIEEAILWHGGEAEESKERFRNLNAEERNAIIKFIESL